MTQSYLVADVGGTNTRVALTHDAQVRPDTLKRFRNDDHGDIADVLRLYLADHRGPVQGACVDVAGPVSQGTGRLTNRDWSISEDTLAEISGASHVAVLNDLQAQGHALAHLPADAFVSVRFGQKVAKAPRLVVNVGTGFNVAPVHPLGARHVVPACEAGHITLPVRTDQDLQLAQHLERHHGMAAVEDVLSGRGLADLHAFVAGLAQALPASEVMAQVGHTAHADETMARFVRFFGMVCGDLALSHLPFGGLALVGGVARATLPYLKAHQFDAAFVDKGRFSPFMDQFAIDAVVDDHAGLVGCAAYLFERSSLKLQIE